MDITKEDIEQAIEYYQNQIDNRLKDMSNHQCFIHHTRNIYGYPEIALAALSQLRDRLCPEGEDND